MAEIQIAARFKLKVRCLNCKADTSHSLAVPSADDAPTDVDGLLDSQFLRDQKFTCRSCEAPIGIIVGVSQEEAAYAEPSAA